MHSQTVAVIGAGPYGLSIAAHLRARRVPTIVFGEPMESWQAMPARMNLKSVWSASSLADPDGAFTLDSFCQRTGNRAIEPIPLAFFIEYARWFQENAVLDVDRARVTKLARTRQTFNLELSDGRELQVGKVVVAIGVRQFAYIPSFALNMPRHLVSHTGDHTDLACFGDKRVAVIGAGQSALETAAILKDEGADVELIARGPVIWINRALYEQGGPVRRILYPASDVGPPGINWLCAAPLLMSRMPVKVRQTIEARAVRPAGAQWLRMRVEGKVPITSHTQVLALGPSADRLRMYLSDGTKRDVDYMMLGTGYRPNVESIPFLDRALLAQVRQDDGFPMLNQWFESSVPGLHFVGGLAGRTFGPICRFVAGARVTAQQVSRRAAELN
jgi:cation diffusion facilitator CzcD-associated flavoprotein CzcO